MNQNIMVVIHDTEESSALFEALCHNQMDVIRFSNAKEAKAGLPEYSPAFVLLDYDIKGMSFLLTEIVNGFFKPHPYIIVVGSFFHGVARASVLRQGADACIGKPIVAEEVLAVIGAVQRRESRNIWSHQGPLLPLIEHLELTIDPLRKIVTMRGDKVLLTVKEFEILYALVSRAGTVLTKEEIYKKVWCTDLDLAASIITDHISSIRKKLGLSSRNNDYIETVFGVGYRFRKPNVEKLN